jgi:spore maturation protein CgeB
VKIVIFVHAISSCWNNDSSHFLRGIGAELQKCGHHVLFCEPKKPANETNPLATYGAAPLEEFRATFPSLNVLKYSPETTDLDRLTDGAHLVLVHESNSPSLVSALGQQRRHGAPFVLLFHDTHRRQLTDPDDRTRFHLGDYDGVLASGAMLAEQYRRTRAAHRTWVWHEAADTTVFYPRATNRTEGDLVWIGDWGDAARIAEIEELMLKPVEALGLFANLYGMHYPESAVQSLAARGIAYHGWVASHQIPEAFARHRLTVHLATHGSDRAFRGMPAIQMFEALACGIPLITARWNDAEGLFPRGCFLVARSGHEMQAHLRDVLSDPALAQSLRENGLKVVHERHSCRHRAEDLLDIYASIKQTAAVVQKPDAVLNGAALPDEVLFPAIGVTPQPTAAS